MKYLFPVSFTVKGETQAEAQLELARIISIAVVNEDDIIDYSIERAIDKWEDDEPEQLPLFDKKGL